VIPWLGTGITGDGDDSDDDSSVVDESGLYGDGTLIDAGVTSGADPTAWDPIGVDGKPDK
jgi:hypothetical protein